MAGSCVLLKDLQKGLVCKKTSIYVIYIYNTDIKDMKRTKSEKCEVLKNFCTACCLCKCKVFKVCVCARVFHRLNMHREPFQAQPLTSMKKSRRH